MLFFSAALFPVFCNPLEVELFLIKSLEGMTHLKKLLYAETFYFEMVDI